MTICHAAGLSSVVSGSGTTGVSGNDGVGCGLPNAFIINVLNVKKG